LISGNDDGDAGRRGQCAARSEHPARARVNDHDVGRWRFAQIHGCDHDVAGHEQPARFIDDLIGFATQGAQRIEARHASRDMQSDPLGFGIGQAAFYERGKIDQRGTTRAIIIARGRLGMVRAHLHRCSPLL
jgi:hypothetical protein